MNYPLTSRTSIQRGIELPWERRERYGPQPTGPGSKIMTDHPPKGTVLESGTAFISIGVLEELLEADHSLGMGGAYLCGYHEGMALEMADLATRETRGGYFTTDDQRARLSAIIDDLYKQIYGEA